MDGTWEYKVSYVDFRGRISTEGAEFIRQGGEHRTGFVRKYLDVLGNEGWELVGIHPLVGSTSYFILRRPKTQAKAGEAAA